MLKRVIATALVAGAPVLLALPVAAQVPVIESAPLGQRPVNQAAAPVGSTLPGFRQPRQAASANPNPQAELFYQLQVLQQEVLELRGLVEEQAHELKRLKQQRHDDYMDLDRRISGAGTKPGAAVTPTTEPSPGATPVTAVAGSGEKQRYRAAYDLIRQRQFDEAIAALDGYLGEYPQGQYSANAHYWLGEIYLQKNDLESARQWFTRLIDGFATSRKVPHAKFKLGKVYHLLGDKTQAKLLLQEVARGGTDVASLAEGYLQQNF